MKIAELIKMMAIPTFTSMLLALAMTPPASRAIAEDIKRACELDMEESPLAKTCE
jgi:hypothetical protein